MTRVLIVGAGGHARVVLDMLLDRTDVAVIGLTDADPRRHGDTLLGIPILGPDDVWPDLRKSGVADAIVAVGDNRVRGRLAAAVQAAGFHIITVVHPHANVSHRSEIGVGVAIMAGATVNAGARIGENAVINTGAVVEHDCVIDRDAHIGPGAVLGGGVRVGRGAFVGMGARVLPGLSVGAWSIAGAGCVAVQDIPADVTVLGMPARIAAARSL